MTSLSGSFGFLSKSENIFPSIRSNSIDSSAMETDSNPNNVLNDLNSLPFEIAIKILSYLNHSELLNGIGLTNHYWNKISKHNYLWDQTLTTTFPGDYAEQRENSKKSNLSNYFETYVKALSFFADLELKEKYTSLNQSSFNLTNLTSDCGFLVSTLIILGRFLFAGKTNGTIAVVDVKKGIFVNQFKETDRHNSTISATAIHKGMLITGSHDHIIKIWNIRTGKMIKALMGHSVAIKCLKIQGDILASCDFHKCIFLWNLNTFELITKNNTLELEKDETISCFDFDNSIIVTGGKKNINSNIISIWDFYGQRLHQLKQDSVINNITIIGKEIVSSSPNNNIEVWDRCGLHIKTLEKKESTALVSATYFKRIGNYFVSTFTNGTVRTWHLQNGSIRDFQAFDLFLDFKHNFLFDIQHDMLICLSNRNIIKIWNIETGSLINESTKEIYCHSTHYFIKWHNDRIILANGYNIITIIDI